MKRSPFRRDPGKVRDQLAAWRARSAKLERRAALAPSGPLTAKAGNPIPQDVRDDVRRRSGGRCEAGLPGCTMAAHHQHHRLLRSQGGSHVSPNLLDVCAFCHGLIHANPEYSYDRGLLIRSTDPRAPGDIQVRSAR